jgi:peptide/nickel transport system permease protein
LSGIAEIETGHLPEIEPDRRESRSRSVLKAVGIRLLWAIPTLIFITFLTFIIGEMAPGDAATVRAGEKASAEFIESLREQMGLNRPLMVRYVEFVKNAFVLDFGKSWYPPYHPVRETLVEGMKQTGLLALLAIILAMIIGITCGVIAAIHHNKISDRVAVTFSTLGICIPNFVLAPVLAYFFSIKLGMLPLTWENDRTESIVYYLALPVLILSLRPAAIITRLTRAAMIDVLSQEFIRTAFAKGVPYWRVVFKHGFRNALVPIATAVGTSFGFLLTGSFIVESFFRIPGLGLRSIGSIYQGDYPVVQGTVLLFAVLFILVNLIVDIFLPLLDPRVREVAG